MWTDEFTRLFRMTTASQSERTYTCAVSELIDGTWLAAFLKTYQMSIRADAEEVAAVAFAKWFAFVAAGFQYGLSVRNAALDLSPERLHIELYPDGEAYCFSFRVDSWKMVKAPGTAAGRLAWRERELFTFYRQTVHPLFDALSGRTGISARELWGQLPPKFRWFLDMFQHVRDPQLSERVAADYAYLQGLPGSLFGCKRNPLDVRWRTVESLEDPNQQVYLQPTCCLDYRRSGGQYCFNCPRLKESERADRRAQYRAQAIAQPEL
ncbi:IucA/IucC family C-terminal-domain containing protein [Alicyclobacillus acidiphilus]|jgi:ferric iron reductase protein FhuF|uniref:IucA/IucC family C-terminal-domain containing protein n=1 Tax=Alicyclobacillus acidiphilus TaxID=182455 RepID=UPI0008310E9C|nr:IucA/IucC family C-terminal-domain containing protein [Alicyclobacillus acidiphilus]